MPSGRIAEPAGTADLTLSTALRENVLGGVIAAAGLGGTADTGGEIAGAAARPAALLRAGAGASALSAGERVLLGEWLARLAGSA